MPARRRAEEKKYRANTALHFRDYAKPGDSGVTAVFLVSLEAMNGKSASARTRRATELARRGNGLYVLVSQAIRQLTCAPQVSQGHRPIPEH